MTFASLFPGSPAPRGGFGSRIGRWMAARWNINLLLAVISIGSILFAWEFARPLGIPGISNLPPPSEVVASSAKLLTSKRYWDGWDLSVRRIASGFILAQIIGVPVGLMLAMSRTSFDTFFPVVEIL